MYGSLLHTLPPNVILFRGPIELLFIGVLVISFSARIDFRESGFVLNSSFGFISERKNELPDDKSSKPTRGELPKFSLR